MMKTKQVAGQHRSFISTILLCLALLTARTEAQRLNGILDHGALIRTDTTVRRIHLVFTGHEFANGAETIRRVLSRHRIKASFFLTGEFYRNPAFSGIIAGLHKDGHDLGPHSDKHLLYCTWEDRDSLLVTRKQFQKDLDDNYTAMAVHGIERTPIFMPPYEWYNDVIASWALSEGVTLVNFTPGTSSNADYTTPDMQAKYVTSDSIVARILRYESSSPTGLNGFLLLMHIGVDAKRPDPLHERLDSLLKTLIGRKYRFEPLSAVVQLK